MDDAFCDLSVLLSCCNQGEAPAFLVDDLQKDLTNGFHLKLKGHETAINTGDNKTVGWINIILSDNFLFFLYITEISWLQSNPFPLYFDLVCHCWNGI